MSGDFVSHLSESNAKLCRRIDSVFLVGKAERTSLFTWDFWTGGNLSQNHVLSPLSQLLVDENSSCTAYEYCAKVSTLYFECDLFFLLHFKHSVCRLMRPYALPITIVLCAMTSHFLNVLSVRGSGAVVRSRGLDLCHEPALRMPTDSEG